MVLIWVSAALADCMGTQPVTSPAGGSLPAAATIYHFIDNPDAATPTFSVRGAGGQTLPLDIAEVPAGPGARAWALSLRAPPGEVTLYTGDDTPTATYTVEDAPIDWAGEAALQEARWSSYGWSCSHEDALVLTLKAPEGVVAWALAWEGHAQVMPPSTSDYFGAHRDGELLRVVLGEVNCMHPPSLDWRAAPDLWTFSLTPIRADGQPGAVIQTTLDVAALRTSAGSD